MHLYGFEIVLRFVAVFNCSQLVVIIILINIGVFLMQALHVR